MKKSGILNQELAGLVAGLGHTQCVMLCDAGFPVPEGRRCVDLALTAGIPSFSDCLKALLHEAVFEGIAVAEEMKANNEETYRLMQDTFQAQRWNVVPQTELVRLAQGARFFIRTGELRPYSNLLLYAASGVEAYHKKYLI